MAAMARTSRAGRSRVNRSDFVPAANISSSGMINWTLADFTTALRTGKRPDGSTLNERMPWKETAEMTDGEIEALWFYLRSTGTAGGSS